MSKKLSAKDILVPTITLFAIALVSTLLLALMNNVTADRIAAQAAASAAAARQSVFTEAENFVEQEMKDGTTYFEATDKEGNILGYVFTTGYKGYGGRVEATVGIDNDGVITGVVPGDLGDETPGLGQTATKPSFLKQFVGQSTPLTVVKNDAGEGKIEALTSATITSTAVTNDVNQALELFQTVTGGAK